MINERYVELMSSDSHYVGDIVEDKEFTIEEVVERLNKTHKERTSLATGFDEYQCHVAETLQEQYDIVKKSFNPTPASENDIYLGPIVQRACLRLLDKIAKELGIELR